MAVIGKIRQQSTLVLIIIGGAIMAFVLSDLFSSGGSVFNQTRNLAVVNEEKISIQEYEARVQEAFENFQMNSQSNEPLDESTRSTIREQVWDDMLKDIILGEEMKELGITVTTEELFNMVQGENPHPQIRQAFTNPETGTFNSADVVRFIQNLDQNPETKEQWIAFEKSLKKNKLREKYTTLIKKGIYFTSTEGKLSFEDVNTRMNLMYVKKPYSSISDESVEVSEEELQDYYEENSSDYEQEASRKISYAFFPVGPSEIDQEQARKWAYETYEEFLEVEDDSGFVNINSDQPMDYTYYSVDNFPEGYDPSLDTVEIGTILPPKLTGNIWRIQKLRAEKMAPDSVQARHILINASDRSLEEAEAIADSLVVLLEEGADFGTLALENSDDVASAQDGGNIGWFTEGEMVKPFNDAVFTSSDSVNFKVVETQFGIHIIEVTGKSELKRKLQVAVIERLVEPSRETYADIFNKANSLSINATDKESFETELENQNVTKREAVISSDNMEISGLNNTSDFVRWIKEAKEGDISEAYDVEDAFVVAHVDEVNKKGVAPFEKVRESVKAEVIRKKKAEILAEEMKAAQDIEELANRLNLKIRRANEVNLNNPMLGEDGFEPKVVGKAASLEQGQMSVPIKGMSGVYVVKVDRVVQPSPEEIDVNTGKRILAQGYNMRIDNNAIFSSLKSSAEIEDNRAKFY